MKIHFITLYLAYPKFNLHCTHKFCSTYELQYTCCFFHSKSDAIKFCKVHQFADYTNLLHFSKSVSKLNKFINLNTAFRIVTLQKKAIRIINNQPRNSDSSLLFKVYYLKKQYSEIQR